MLTSLDIALWEHVRSWVTTVLLLDLAVASLVWHSRRNVFDLHSLVCLNRSRADKGCLHAWNTNVCDVHVYVDGVLRSRSCCC